MTAYFDLTAYQSNWRRNAYMFTANCFGSFYSVYFRVSVTGRENVPDGPFVAVGNHLSNWDPPMLSYSTNRPLAFLAKKELYSIPVLKTLILFFGAISIDRDKPEISTFKAVKQMFKSGWGLGMFIEGTRSKTPGVLGQPHNGPAYFAKTYKVPIVPVGIIGTDKPWQKAYAHIGKPINAGDDVDETTWQIMEALSQLTGFDLPERKI
jgi:1-acyl-sn-glycerol-3-phosphate acyltransferase